MDRSCELKQNISLIKGKIGNSCLVAVSKYTSSSDILEALKVGHLDFGESRVQDLRTKTNELQAMAKSDHEINLIKSLKWHFIGHLQTNKVKMLLKVSGLKFIHSVDSHKLLDAVISNEHLIESEELSFFLQVNVSGEDEKGGFASYQELKDAVTYFYNAQSSKLKLCGLMTIGRVRTNNFEEDARSGFLKIRSMRDKLQEDFMSSSELKLSMGMSSDYLIAVEEGSDFVRIGRAIFG